MIEGTMPGVESYNDLVDKITELKKGRERDAETIAMLTKKVKAYEGRMTPDGASCEE